MMNRYTTTPMLGAAACAVLALGVALYGAPGKAQGPTAAATEADRDTAQPPGSADLDSNFWVLVRDSTNPEALQSYLQSFPSGKFAAQARQKLATLREQQDKTVRAAPAPTSVEMPQNIARTTPTPAPQAVPPAAENKELARELQRELKRIGCLDGEVDGVWGEKSRAALKDFVRYAKLGVPGDEPNISVLDAASAARSRVCPLVCDNGEKMVGDRCVTVTKARPAHQEQVRQPRREPRRAWAAEPSEPRGNPNSGKRICFGPRPNEIVTCP